MLVDCARLLTRNLIMRGGTKRRQPWTKTVTYYRWLEESNRRTQKCIIEIVQLAYLSIEKTQRTL